MKDTNRKKKLITVIAALIAVASMLAHNAALAAGDPLASRLDQNVLARAAQKAGKVEPKSETRIDTKTLHQKEETTVAKKADTAKSDSKAEEKKEQQGKPKKKAAKHHSAKKHQKKETTPEVKTIAQESDVAVYNAQVTELDCSSWLSLFDDIAALAGLEVDRNKSLPLTSDSDGPGNITVERTFQVAGKKFAADSSAYDPFTYRAFTNLRSQGITLLQPADAAPIENAAGVLGALGVTVTPINNQSLQSVFGATGPTGDVITFKKDLILHALICKKESGAMLKGKVKSAPAAAPTEPKKVPAQQAPVMPEAAAVRGTGTPLSYGTQLQDMVFKPGATKSQLAPAIPKQMPAQNETVKAEPEKVETPAPIVKQPATIAEPKPVKVAEQPVAEPAKPTAVVPAPTQPAAMASPHYEPQFSDFNRMMAEKAVPVPQQATQPASKADSLLPLLLLQKKK